MTERLQGVASVPHATLHLGPGPVRDLLHRVTTQALEVVRPGQVRSAGLLTPEGRVVGLFDVLLGAEEAWLWMDPAYLAPVQQALARYAMLMDIELTPRSDEAARLVFGLGAEDVLRDAGWVACDPEVHATGSNGRIVRTDLGEVPAWRCVSNGGPLPAVTADADAHLEQARIRAGVAGPAEAAAAALFNELAQEGHVSWSKGCYPGQEPVIMARHRGRPPRLLCVLGADEGVPPGMALHADGRAVGVVTSVAPTSGGQVALGLVRHALALPGRLFETPEGRTVTLARVVGAATTSG